LHVEMFNSRMTVSLKFSSLRQLVKYVSMYDYWWKPFIDWIIDIFML
jgi:hypothetical protein